MFSNYQGLTQDEADKRALKYGKNVLPESKPPSNLVIFLSQFKNPLVYVLFFAGVVSLFLNHLTDFVVISMAVFINTILGFIQESRAGKTLESLKKMVTATVEIIREGKKYKIDTSDIVPGDILFLSEGVRIPSDSKVLFANRFFVDESILTGESVPVEIKRNGPTYMGSVVTGGQAIVEVQSIGGLTKLGQIAVSVQEKEEDTPLKKQLVKFSKSVLFVVLFLTILVFVLGLLLGQEIFDIFQTSVALAVSAIPEGLLVSLTVVLAIGMQRILKRNGLVKNLSSAETLGGVTTICVDKTGTLTEGKMRVVDYDGDVNDLAKQAIIANDLDDPIVITAFEWARKYVSDFISKHQRLDSIPFSSKDRFFLCLNKWDDRGNMLFINGAPEILIDKCNLSENERKDLLSKVEKWAVSGKRVIGFARKVVPKSKTEITKGDANKFTWVGMIAFTDPVRAGVSEALANTVKAGIKIKFITGDYPATAKFVLEEIGIQVSDDEIIEGAELAKLSDKELEKKVLQIKLFARTTPDQKLKIVNALKANGQIVAMMGDGVNDAPALKKADIGIVVSSATDVARESSDLILMDSNFATITAAIEEGRGIFENLRKIILYLLSDAFGEIIIVLGGIVLKLPLPLTAVQILWINLVSDGFPGLALTVDNKSNNIMEKAPRLIKEPLVTNWMKYVIAVVSLSSGILALIFFVYVLKTTGDYQKAKSVAFLTLGINSLIYVFSIKNLTNPFWKGKMFSNKWLNISVLAGLALQAVPFVVPNMRTIFGTVELEINYWIVSFGISLLMFIIIEVFKNLKYQDI